MSYFEHQKFYAAALDRCEIWRTALGGVLIATVFVMLNAGYFAVIASALPGGNANPFFDDIAQGDTPHGLTVLLVTFGFLTTAVGVVVRTLHRRGLRTLVGLPHQAARDFLRVLAGFAPFYGGVVLLLLLTGPSVSMGLPIWDWLMFLPLSLALLFVQVSAEEIAFRGYLQQQLAARFSNPVLWSGAPALLFAALHYDVEAGANAGWIAAWAGLFALAAADLTARSGNLGAATALHFANNFVGMLIISMPGSLSGLSMLQYSFSVEDTQQIARMLPVDLAVLGVSWLLARVILRR